MPQEETRSAIGAEGRRRRPVGIETVDSPSLADARAGAAAESGPGNDHKGVKGVSKDHEFDLDYIDDRGRRWSGHFKCHALNYREVINVGLTRSRLAGGVAPRLLDLVTSQMLEMIAHLAIALNEAPPWANKLDELMDPGVVGAIYKEVADHAGRFRGAEPEGSGAAAGERSGDDDGTRVDAQNR